jgi:hypothetical protein
MNNILEQTFINKYVIKEKRNRYLNFIAKEKTRKKFTRELAHTLDLDWRKFREISGNDSEKKLIISKIEANKHISSCYVISYWEKYDGKLFSVDDAINDIIGEQEVILIFGNAEVVYYEGEAPGNRYISIE